MDKLQIRMDRRQVEILLGALGTAIASSETPAGLAGYAMLYTWLSDRYTRVWGLPPASAQMLRMMREGHADPASGPTL